MKRIASHHEKATLVHLSANRYVIHLCHRRGVVVIVSASETEDRGFESRQGVRFLGLKIFQ
jgi:hypothetical protein